MSKTNIISSTFFGLRILGILLESHRAISANIFVWPLGAGSLISEIKENGDQGQIGDVTFAAGPPDLGYQVFAFKGTSASFIDLRVPASSSLFSDTTFMFYIYLETGVDGTLFQFQSDDTNTDETLTGIDATFDSSFVHFDFGGNSESWSVGFDSVPNTITTGQWVHIAFERDYNNGNMKLFVDGSGTSISGTTGEIRLGLPGTLRLGYSQPSDVPLHGRVACFIIQDGRFDSGSLSSNLQDCNSSNWQTTTGPCSADCSSYKGYFLLAETGKVPLGFIPRIDSATNLTSRRCASKCLAHSQCVSFIIQDSVFCEVFYGDHTNYMESSTGDTNYYVRRDKCCM